MSSWRGEDRLDVGDALGLSWACEVYQGLMFWKPLFAVAMPFVLPVLVYMMQWQANQGTAAAVAMGPLILAAIVTGLPALVLTSLGLSGRANETYFFSQLQQLGFSQLHACDSRPPLLGPGLLRFTYMCDLGCYPAGRHNYGQHTYSECRRAWSIVRAALRAYYRECLAAGLAPVLPVELLSVALLSAVAGASLVLLPVAIMGHPAAQLLGPSTPVGIYIAFFALIYSFFAFDQRTEARVAAFLRALQAHLMTHSAAGDRWQETDAAAPPDTGWS